MFPDQLCEKITTKNSAGQPIPAAYPQPNPPKKYYKTTKYKIKKRNRGHFKFLDARNIAHHFMPLSSLSILFVPYDSIWKTLHRCKYRKGVDGWEFVAVRAQGDRAWVLSHKYCICSIISQDSLMGDRECSRISATHFPQVLCLIPL